MAGAYYIWIMLAFFLGCGAILFLLMGIFWIGHMLEKKQTGATHNFLEVPQGAASRPAPASSELASEPSSQNTSQ